MSTFTEIQQAFVRQYMNDDGVIGVSIRKIEGQMVLVVDVSDEKRADLPLNFRNLPVIVRKGRRAALAYV